MSDVKVNIYTQDGQHVGYFLNPKVDAFPDDDYEIIGHFFDGTGTLAGKMDFNPQVLPYIADLTDVENAAHKKLERVFLQRGRQPIRMTGTGTRSSRRS